MKYHIKILIILACLGPLLQNCDDHIARPIFDKAMIPMEPENFMDVNSEYDDYNSSYYWEESWMHFELTFSTNRDSRGDNYDLITYHVDLEYDMQIQELHFSTYHDELGYIFWDLYDKSGDFVTCRSSDFNTDYNELGPYSLYYESGPIRRDEYGSCYAYGDYQTHARFLFADDKNGHLDIYCWYFHDYAQYDILDIGWEYLDSINSSYNDAYPCISVDAEGQETIYFTSDREGSYDIFDATGSGEKIINRADTVIINKINNLSSDKDDTCPFVLENIMLFASNRDGGYGGYDLYFSVFGDNGWSEPENFGAKINTEHDEFRPVFIQTPEDDYFADLMIFSSNRPGGQGGFDLYYTGISKSLFE